MDYAYLWGLVPRFYRALLVTLQLAGWGIGLSLLLGLAVALLRSYRLRWLTPLAGAYVELSRNTPLLSQLFFLYFGLPKLGIHWSEFTCGVIALAFLGGSYMGEALRAGLQAVPTSQIEAARALTLSPSQIFRFIVLPQALAVALPALTANVIFLIKETSVIYAVSVPELMAVTKDVIVSDYHTNEALLMLLLSYALVLLPLVLLAHWLERRSRRYA